MKKTILLVRHAESEANVQSRIAGDALINILSFKSPLRNLSVLFDAALTILKLGHDAKLSKLGLNQVILQFC